MARRVRSGLAVLALTGAALLAGAGQASALPYPGPNESVIIQFYSDASRTDMVGAWSYGHCGADYRWGQMTQYSTWWTQTC